MKPIYLDYSATTPVDEKVLSAMLPFLNDKFGNPSSLHSFGQDAIKAVDKAREQAAAFLNCEPIEIIFTSGATEANNLAIKGLVKALAKKGFKDAHIISSWAEHDSVLEPLRELEKEGVEVTFLPLESNGKVEPEKLKKAIKKNTVLVSIVYVNSEVGVVQPIREIGKIIKNLNDKKLREWKKRHPKEREENKPMPVYFHTDATQAVNFFNCDAKWNYFDMLSLSGHKIYGPKGVGALYKKDGVPIDSLQQGGHHENNLRSGTLNVPGIIGLGQALSLINKKEKEKNIKKIAAWRDLLVEGIQKKIPNTKLNTDRSSASPFHAHFTFFGAEGESVLIALDLAGVAVSTGSACASRSLKGSVVLSAMGIEKSLAHYSVRFTLGKNNNKEEIIKVLKILPPIIKRLRDMNPVYKKTHLK